MESVTPVDQSLSADAAAAAAADKKKRRWKGKKEFTKPRGAATATGNGVLPLATARSKPGYTEGKPRNPPVPRASGAGAKGGPRSPATAGVQAA